MHGLRHRTAHIGLPTFNCVLVYAAQHGCVYTRIYLRRMPDSSIIGPKEALISSRNVNMILQWPHSGPLARPTNSAHGHSHCCLTSWVCLQAATQQWEAREQMVTSHGQASWIGKKNSVRKSLTVSCRSKHSCQSHRTSRLQTPSDATWSFCAHILQQLHFVV